MVQKKRIMNKNVDYHSANSLTDYQKRFIRMHAGLVSKKIIAKKLRVWESAVSDYIRRHRLDQNCHQVEYRREITPITRFQICVCDFEGYLPEAISNLYCIRPQRVSFLIDEMKESGEYDLHIGKFEDNNEGAYNRAMNWRAYVET